MKCLCGNTRFSTLPHFYYHVSESGESYLAKDTMTLEQCNLCGLSRQSSFSDLWEDKKYDAFYKKYPPVSSKYKVKDFEHDREVAKSRADFYALSPGNDFQVLDIGCGSGAFVAECLDRGIKAYGCELAEYSSSFSHNIYRKRFEDIHFPTDSFYLVTCHDVLEHVASPLSFLREVFRVTAQEGTAWIEIPDFFCKDGEKHWKKEHLWFFNLKNITSLLEQAGFKFQSATSPIPGKLLFQVEKPIQKRTTILVPPGIGDSYWSVVKMEGMLKEYGLSLPDVSVVCPRAKKHNGHQRAFPFLEMFPFIHASWDVVDNQDASHKLIWKEAYACEGRTLFKNVLDNDYFLSYNGHLRVGKELADIDPQWECNWFPPMFVSYDQEAYKEFSQKRYGKYIVFYFIFQGTYCYWTRQFPLPSVAESVRKICAATSCKPVFVGGKWDAEDIALSSIIRDVPGAINLVGKTSLQQAFGLIQGSEMVVGYPSGLTIMSAVLKKKTMVIWNDYYNRDFFQNAMPPAVRGKTYWAESTYNLSSDTLQDHCQKIINNEIPKIRPLPAHLTVVSPAAIRNNPVKPFVQNTASKVASTAVICVLKSGGDFTEDYVRKLFASIQRHSSTEDMEFICLTDLKIDSPFFRTEPLLNNYPGWWSKVEVFRPKLTKAEMCVYIDLDTVILGDISDLLQHKVKDTFSALLPWNEKNRASGNFASGIMRWQTSLYHFLYDEFQKHDKDTFLGDQQYFSSLMMERGYPWSPLQQFFPGIYSYKRNVRNGRVLRDARIICFHGKPRPHEVRNQNWIKENWTI